MKLVKILSVFAVIAAAGMAAVGCESIIGGGNGYDGAVSAEITAPGSVSAGGTTAFSAAAFKIIRLKFEVINGGLFGLNWSEGIAGSQDNSRLIYGRAHGSDDYAITIIVPAGDEYLNIYWMCSDDDFTHRYYYCEARTKAESHTITFDHNGWENGKPQLATKNLYVTGLFWDHKGGYKYPEAWDDIKRRAGSNEFEGGRKIKVKFNVKNGGWGLWNSEGIVSTQDDSSYLVYEKGVCANDYTITILVTPEDEYLNVRWKCRAGVAGETLVRARMKAESGTITLDYNGGHKVATKNLYDVVVGDNHYRDINSHYEVWLGQDWDDAKKRSVNDSVEEFL